MNASRQPSSPCGVASALPIRARSAQRRRDSQRTRAGRLATAAVCVVAGLLVVVSALNARGTDLRPGRNTDLVSLVQSESRRNADSPPGDRASVGGGRVVRGAERRPGSRPGHRAAPSSAHAGLIPVSGPSVTVTLTTPRRRWRRRGRSGSAGRAPARHPGGGQRAVVRWRRGDDHPGPTGDLHHRHQMRRQHGGAARHSYAPPYGSVAIGDPAKLAAGAGRLGDDPDLPAVRRRVTASATGAASSKRLPGYEAARPRLRAGQRTRARSTRADQRGSADRAGRHGREWSDARVDSS